MARVEVTPAVVAHIAQLANRRVFVTGHTGFKGSWLVHYLDELGAEIAGYALAPATAPALFTLSKAADALRQNDFGDIRDAARLKEAMARFQPDVVLHLAAQPLVRHSYANPHETWDVNVMGTVNLLEAVRATRSVRATVIVTTDKVYENKGWCWGYREADALGGHDPYSASKAASEIVVSSYGRSFFGNGPALASARGGNVIGGGDWASDRLLADAARSVASGQVLSIRNPQSTRPWQHVLDCLSGYLTLAGALLDDQTQAAGAYNIGPPESDNWKVADLLDELVPMWPGLRWDHVPSSDAPHEASYLYLDSARARHDFGWSSRWPLARALAATSNWYLAVAEDAGQAYSLTRSQIREYMA